MQPPPAGRARRLPARFLTGAPHARPDPGVRHAAPGEKGPSSHQAGGSATGRGAPLPWRPP